MTSSVREDTIVAPVTGAGPAPVAIIRLSGPEAVAIFARLFKPASGKTAEALESHHLAYGTVRYTNDSAIDDALGVIMRAPHSFTGEDVAEIQCHGGRAVVAAILDACVAAGARLAEPGEFSKRAFLNRRMDLAQAEAVSDLIAARTELSRRLALRQLHGGLSQRIAAVRDSLVDAAAELEAHIDFPDEDIPTLAHDRIGGVLNSAQDEIARLLAGSERGRFAREGARVVLAGKPNAGKSSLFNALAGYERAIVTPHPGTTRDTIECTLDIGGVPVTLVDTAGERESKDEIERMGIERTAREVQTADVVLRTMDATTGADFSLQTENTKSDSPREILVVNKSDLLAQRIPDGLRGNAPGPAVLVSAVTRAGIAELERALVRMLIGDGLDEELQIASARHATCLRDAAASLGRAREAFANNLSGEFVMVDLRDAIMHLGDILGIRLDEEILDRVFSTFCLGK